MLSDPSWKRLMPAIMLLKAEMGTMAELDQDLKEQQFEVMVSVLQRGVAEGYLRPEVVDDVSETITLFAGPLLMAALAETVPLTHEFADRAVEHFLAANLAPCCLPKPLRPAEPPDGQTRIASWRLTASRLPWRSHSSPSSMR